MAYSPEDIKANRDFFAAKLRAMKQKADVQHWAKEEPGGGDFVLLDVRTRDAFAKSHVKGAVSAPLAELSDLMAQLPREKELVTYCWSATWHLAAKAALQLAEHGFFVKEMNVGWAEWQADNSPMHSERVAKGALRCSCSR
jgi:rhodanese-related sulfurtransferase